MVLDILQKHAPYVLLFIGHASLNQEFWKFYAIPYLPKKHIFYFLSSNVVLNVVASTTSTNLCQLYFKVDSMIHFYKIGLLEKFKNGI